MVTHNCEQYDYCYQAALTSLIDTCDEVVVVDANSTDGTRDILSIFGGASKSVKIIDAQWNPVPGTNGAWLSDLYNLAKSKSTCRYDCTMP